MTSTKYSRRSAREAVLQALYALEIGEESRSKVIKDIIENDAKYYVAGYLDDAINNYHKE